MAEVRDYVVRTRGWVGEGQERREEGRGRKGLRGGKRKIMIYQKKREKVKRSRVVENIREGEKD